MVPAAFCGELFQMYPDQRLFHRMQGKVVTVMVVVHTPPFHIISSCIDQPAALDADRIVADPVVDQPCLVGQSVALWKTKKLSNIYIYIYNANGTPHIFSVRFCDSHGQQLRLSRLDLPHFSSTELTKASLPAVLT